MLQHHSELQEENLQQLISDILSRENCVRLIARGHSMYPFIKDGEAIIIRPIKFSKVNCGDIILYHISQKLIAHRVIEKNKEDKKLVTKGDSKFNFDSPIEEENIMGKVTVIEKSKIKINLDCEFWLVANRIISKYGFMSTSIYKGLYFVRKLLTRDRETFFVIIVSRVIFFTLLLFPMLLINFFLIYIVLNLKSKISIV